MLRVGQLQLFRLSLILSILRAAHAACPAETDSSLLPWGASSTWPELGSPPSPGDNVTLTAGMHVLLSSSEAPYSSPLVLSFVHIEEGASLVVATHGIAIELHTRGIEVRGELRAGSAECPTNASVIIELYGGRLPLSNRGTPPPALRKGIHVLGSGSAYLYGASVGESGWTRLAFPHAVGASSLLVRGGAESWAVGSRIVVATTHFRDHRKYSENEERTLTAVSPFSGRVTCVQDATADGLDSSLCATSELFLDFPLVYAHYAHENEANYAAEVMLLSRSLVVRGSNESEFTPEGADADKCQEFRINAPCADEALDGDGGHILAEGSEANLHLENVELFRMGQTNVRGRYPVHFHMMGEAQGRASVRQCAVHHSFFRCFAVHGTMAAFIGGNAAYDAIGSCYYLEDGVEERNNITGNLAMHIHFIISPETATPGNEWRTERANLGFPVGIWTAFGQFQPDFLQVAGYLDQPADIAASGFYLPNLYNYVVGNAASGGWAGFNIPSMSAPIGMHREVELAPNKRPPLQFSGNSAHSSGFWWAEAGCLYAGGKIFERLVTTDNASSYVPVYNPGRNVNSGILPESGDDGSSGDTIFAQFHNTTVAMSLGQGFKVWAGRTHLSGIRALDTARGVSVLGDHHLENILIECRTSNAPTRWDELRTWHQELKFWESNYDAFGWYDQGQRHIVDGIEFEGCEEASGLFVLWSGGDRAHAQVQMSTRRVAYKVNGSKVSPPVNAISWMGPTEPCSWDPNRTMIQQQWMQQNWMDLDGTASGRGSPTLIGSALAGSWWQLDSTCDRNWNLWLCDLVRDRWPAAVQLRWQSGLHTDSLFGYDVCGGSIFSCSELTTCPQLGYVTHIGSSPGVILSDSERRLALTGSEGVPITANGALTGPAGGFGWFVHLFKGAPVDMKISNIQLPCNSTQLVLAFQYPPGTTFLVESRGASWCSDSWRTWGDLSQSRSCAWAHRKVASLEEVRLGRGDTYYAEEGEDGSTFLFVRALPTSSYFNQANGASFEWNADVLLSPNEQLYPYMFTRSGVSIVQPACSEPTELCGTYVHIQADCEPSISEGAYCDIVSPVVVPAAGCALGMVPVPGSFDECVQAPPTPLPSAEPTARPTTATTVTVAVAFALQATAPLTQSDEVALLDAIVATLGVDEDWVRNFDVSSELASSSSRRRHSRALQQTAREAGTEVGGEAGTKAGGKVGGRRALLSAYVWGVSFEVQQDLAQDAQDGSGGGAAAAVIESLSAPGFEAAVTAAVASVSGLSGAVTATAATRGPSAAPTWAPSTATAATRGPSAAPTWAPSTATAATRGPSAAPTWAPSAAAVRARPEAATAAPTMAAELASSGSDRGDSGLTSASSVLSIVGAVVAGIFGLICATFFRRRTKKAANENAEAPSSENVASPKKTCAKLPKKPSLDQKVLGMSLDEESSRVGPRVNSNQSFSASNSSVNSNEELETAAGRLKTRVFSQSDRNSRAASNLSEML